MDKLLTILYKETGVNPASFNRWGYSDSRSWKHHYSHSIKRINMKLKLQRRLIILPSDVSKSWSEGWFGSIIIKENTLFFASILGTEYRSRSWLSSSWRSKT